MNYKILAFYKRIYSYFNANWDLKNYPLRYRRQEDKNDPNVKPWVVQIINWWGLTGIGNSKDEAYEMLRNNFEKYKTENEKLPRPGCNVELQYADTFQIDQLEDVAVDFFDKIMEYDYYNCFISDESSLMDFGIDEFETLQRINQVYNLDIKEIGDGNFVRIFKLISNNTKPNLK